jgi:phosphoglycerate dehydrogenase-like enzyme
LRLIASTATVNASIDLAAAAERGVQLVHTGYSSAPTVELTWALILADARHLVTETTAVRGGGWQQSVGEDLNGRTLGLLGLGNIGSAVARIGKAFGMNLIAWSQNLTAERAAAVDAVLVPKEKLFQQADVITIHLVLSRRTRGLVGAPELRLMKRTARLVNTSRGPIVDEAALVDVLRKGEIAGAAIDVFDQEPLPSNHPFRQLPNVLATPHIGYVSRGLYQRFYQDTVENIREWLDAKAASTSGGLH